MKNLVFLTLLCSSSLLAQFNLNEDGYAQTPITDANIQTAVDQWICCPSSATNTYGTISDWDVSQVTDMSELFQYKSTFNDDISKWDVRNVTDMKYMFRGAGAFNQDIGSWDVSNVTNMEVMFYNASTFNQDIGSWDVSSVTDMRNMFKDSYSGNASFNQDIGSWDVSNVQEMDGMFFNSSFNKDIGSWDVSSVVDMKYMFYGASDFNQDLSTWCVENFVSEPYNFSNNSPLAESNKPVWGTCPTASVDDQNQSGISIYPNPTTSIITIQEEGVYNIEVYSLQGRKLIIHRGNSIDLSALSNAMYLIKATNTANKQQQIYKVIKE